MAPARRHPKSMPTQSLRQDLAFKAAFGMTLLIWTLGGLAIALAVFAG
jgi:hypothetical protein